TATDNWHSSQARTRTVAEVRAVLDMIAQDLRQAVATTNFPITIDHAPASYGSTNSAIQFVQILPASGTNQYAIAAIRYDVLGSNNTFRLIRWKEPLPLDASGTLPGTITDSQPFGTPASLADGLAAFRIAAPAEAGIIPAGARVPPYLDIYLELLGDEDRRAAAGLSGTPQLQFVERHALRFSQRVFLPTVNRWNLP
ncbi:MAG: hypothetical protein WCR06_11785, partial [bacterium]